MKKSKKAVIMLVAAILCQLWAQPIAWASGGAFSDVSATCEEYDEIMEAVELGLFEGVSKGTFAPEAPMTNAMFAVALSRLHGVQPDSRRESEFADVPAGKWYTDAAAWAKEVGIASGSLFLPNAPVTRAQAAAMLGQYAGYAGIELPDGLLPEDSGDPEGTLTRAEAAAALVRLSRLGGEAPADAPSQVPSLAVTSTIFGSADTGNKSTLKARLIKASGPGDQTIYYFNEDGVRTPYEEGAEVDLPTVAYTGEAVLALNGIGVDDSKIDSSTAVVKLAPGDGYYPEELVLKATTLNGEWKDGKLSYTLKEGDLSWDTGDYPLADFNSSREWSCFGGDGNGCHIFNFQVSGITYDGQPVAPAIFQVRVYIYGRAADDMAPDYRAISAEAASSGKKAGGDIQWTWQGEDAIGKPILCDDKADNFFVTWPNGTDASGLTAGDVTVTLRSQYGDTYRLPESKYTVFSGEDETQVAVTFQHVAYTPVYTTMEIAVSGQCRFVNDELQSQIELEQENAKREDG